MEPPHIHVERDDNIAKFWLDPVRLQRSDGFFSDRDRPHSETCCETPNSFMGGLE